MISDRFQSQPTAVASYDYQDLADGLGLITFYPFYSEGAGTYHLGTTTEIVSEPPDLNVNNGTYTFNASVFNTPRVAKGNAIIVIPVFYDTGATLQVQLQKVSGGVATNIHTAQSLAKGAVSNYYLNFNVALTETSFKVGDNLRLVVTISGESGTSYIGIDPANNAGVSLTPTKSFILIPFKVLE